MSLFDSFDADAKPRVFVAGTKAIFRRDDWQLVGETEFGEQFCPFELYHLSTVGLRLYQHRTDSGSFVELSYRAHCELPVDSAVDARFLDLEEAKQWFAIHDAEAPNHLAHLEPPTLRPGMPLPEPKASTVADDSESSESDSVGLGAILESDVPSLILASRKTPRHVVVDQVMRKTLREIPESEQWGQREWADYLKCSPKTLQKCPTWKGNQRTREARKQARVIPRGIGKN